MKEKSDLLYNQKSGYEIYKFYIALKRHFTSDYDYFKYKGRIKASLGAFEKRDDKYQFYKLGNRIEAKELILSNMLENPNIWVGDLFNEESESIRRQWRRRVDSLSYTFVQDIKLLTDTYDNDIKVVNGQHPRLLKLYLSRDVCIETLIILNELTPFFDYWDQMISETFIWPDINRKCRKYRPFLDINRGTMKDLFLNRYIDQIHRNTCL